MLVGHPIGLLQILDAVDGDANLIPRHLWLKERGRCERRPAEEYEREDGSHIIPAKPTMPKIEVRNEKKRVLKHEEEELVFKAIDARIVAEPSRQWQRFRGFVRVLLDTGFRRSEALLLGSESLMEFMVDGEPMLCVGLPQYQTKNDKPRVVPCTQAIIDLIPTFNTMAVDGRWFPLKAVAWYMWSNIRADVKALGGDIDDVGLHTLRHTCITRLALGGMELQRLSLWAGHSDVSITAKKYSHLDASALAKGVAILGTTPTSGGNVVAFTRQSVKRNDENDAANRAEPGHDLARSPAVTA
jgi:integrase